MLLYYHKHTGEEITHTNCDQDVLSSRSRLVFQKTEGSQIKNLKAGYLTQQNKWWTSEDLERTTSTEPPPPPTPLKLLVDSLPSKVVWNTDHVLQ